MSDEPTIGILRMPMGNLRSAYNAIYENGFDPLFVDSDTSFDHLTHLIVPGVGNFKAVMGHLEKDGLAGRIRAFAASGRPLLGICAGMQLLARCGTESGITEGLDLIGGTVTRLPEGGGRLLPHVGWSTVKIRVPHAIFEGIKPGRDFYFVHSYAMHTDRDEECIGETEYGEPFASIVAKDNVVGFQFHPEKSQANGLKLLENFCRWDGRC
ncbi:MAG: imidazole glycerol phosphate synthase subunit HisH [Pseudomonadota bacterium]|nr:imidazole glycerol phosphate synthase subunit HisH [Pseudomonadota bacterium]